MVVRLSSGFLKQRQSQKEMPAEKMQEINESQLSLQGGGKCVKPKTRKLFSLMAIVVN